MKKLLLIAAMAALAFGANADGYKIEKVWEYDVTFLTTANVRQGFGMDGKFYINDRTTVFDSVSGEYTTVPTIHVIDQNGLTDTSYPGTTNCGITRDEAGNILVSTATFPGAWGATAGIKVINPQTGESIEYIVPEECGMQGRCDFLGFAKGNFFEDGMLYLTGGNTGTDPYTDGVAIFAVSGGEVNFDECRLAVVNDGITGQTSTVINYYTDINGEEALVYAYRSGAPSKLMADGDFFNKTAISLPANKGACNGIFPFIWDGKELFIYPTLPNYNDGFAIAASGDTISMVEVAPTSSANPNGFQAHWLNAEVDNEGVTIYEYVPGRRVAVWRLTKEADAPNVYMLGGNDQPWDCTNGTAFEYDAENGVYTATITFPAEENYFGFTTELAENNDDGGWSYIEPFRFGAIADEGTDYWYTGEEEFVSLTWDAYHAIRIPGGEYKLTINLNEMKLYVENLNPQALRGDVDLNGKVEIADVTTLIDLLLSGGETPAEADCDLSGDVGIADVTALIDYLLSGVWPAE